MMSDAKEKIVTCGAAQGGGASCSVGVLTEAYGTMKSTALKVLREHCQNNDDFVNDNNIHAGIQRCLDTIQTGGVAFRHGMSSGWQICLSMDLYGDKDYILNIINRIAISPRSEVSIDKYKENSKDFVFVSCCLPGGGKHSVNDQIILISPSEEVFLKDNNSADPKVNVDLNERSTKWFNFAATLREIFIQRNRAYHHFHDRLSMLYWNSISILDQPQFTPPWDKSKDSVLTITLSLDLRKSTLAMEQAREHSKYAAWMHDVLKALTDTALEHYAVFDKFTGDGVIVHFLVEDTAYLLSEDGIQLNEDDIQCYVMERAVICATHMIGKVDDQLGELRENLLNDCVLFGAAVGIGVDQATWRTDHTGNPIVVGRGVVGACRAADKAERGMIRLINSAYQDYKKTSLGLDVPAQPTPYVNKEHPPEHGMRVWELDAKEVFSAIGHRF